MGTHLVSPSDLPFPPLPKRLNEAFGAAELRLRRFGTEASAVELDFNRPAPLLVSEVLSCCAERGDGIAPDRGLFGELSVSARIICLLLLVGLEGVETLVVILACPELGCGEEYELDLALDEVLAFASTDVDEPFALEFQTSLLILRRPTGNDQLAWLSARFEDGRAARIAILRSLALSDLPEDLDESLLARIEADLDEHDPLVCFSLTTTCPSCGASAFHEISLSDLALRVLHGAQSRLIEAVHLLATRYGWSETAVLEIPAWRRERYLSLIGSDSA